MRQDPVTGEVTNEGLSDMRGLLSESGMLDLVNAGMPMITAIAMDQMESVHDLRSKPTGWIDCGAAFLVLAGAVLVVVAACGTPEPAQPLACWGAVVAAIGAAVQAIQACNFPDRCKVPC
jgi:drug/metabolite transporter (DMT)-like permease